MGKQIPETPSIGLGAVVLGEELIGMGAKAGKDFYKKHWQKFAAAAGLLQVLTSCKFFPGASAAEPTPKAPITQPVDPNVIPVLPPQTPAIQPTDVLFPRFGPTPFVQEQEYATEVEKQFKNYLDTSPDAFDFEKTAVFDRDASTTIVATGVGSEQDRKQIVFDWLTTRDPKTNEPYYYVRFVDADGKAQFVSPSNPTKASNFKRNADGTITWSLTIPTKGGFIPIIQETFIPNADPDKIMPVKTVFTHPVTGEQITIETKTANNGNGNQQIARDLEQILRFFDIRPKIAEAAALSPEEIVKQDVQNSFEQQKNAPTTMLAVRAYANAFGLKEQDVMNELVIQSRKDSKGNIFYTADVKDGTPLFIATQDQKTGEWGWRSRPEEINVIGARLNDLENYGISGIDPSQGDSLTDPRIPFFPNVEANVFGVNYILRNGPDKPDFGAINNARTAFNRAGSRFSYGFVFPTNPKYFSNLLTIDAFKKMTPQQWENFIVQYAQTFSKTYPDINEIVISNELIWGIQSEGKVGLNELPWFNPKTDSSVPYPNFLRKVCEAIKSTNPTAKRVFGESDIFEFDSSAKYKKTYETVKALYEVGLIDKLMLQGHFRFDFNFSYAPSPTAPKTKAELIQFKETLKNRLRPFMVDLGIPTGIYELDAIFSANSSVPENERPQVAANVEATVVEAYLEMIEEVKNSSLPDEAKKRVISSTSLYHWGLDKQTAWKQFPDYQNDYSLFSNGQPLPSIYAVSKAFFNKASGIK